ncbi:glutamyl-tRNA reductase [Campylobacter sp.]|uniref:glutamyl-tRNA reductase n=1 Tax=Campylobacter sp. TaxID=205 RepID=UPI0026DBC051|nr:glutamyl-tRNA reductase [Campylobacter sp.]MDO4673757.1 glutamyl-tRNA reductase [Campylobacter sp.]
MEYFCISFTHKNTNLALRERLSLGDLAQKREFLKLIAAKDSILESLIISTCNRVEILAFVRDTQGTDKHIITSLALLCGVDYKELMRRADIFEGSGAIHHLFSVASSLDSLVVGETQITGQIKNAFDFAKEGGFCGENLALALHHALKCAARVRNETQISKNPISVASVAVSKARELLELEGEEALIIGAGEMAALAARHLLQAGGRVVILARSLEKAKNLSQNLGAKSRFDALDRLELYLQKHALFFCATNAAAPIITDDLLRPCAFRRYFFDMAVPRDVLLSKTEGVEVFAVDDLKEIVQRNLALRECEAKIAYRIISAATREFFKNLSELTLTPTIKALRLLAKQCADEQLARALAKGYLKKSDEEEARRLIHQVFKAFLHGPTLRLKNLQNNAQNFTQSLEYLFGLNQGENDEIH